MRRWLLLFIPASSFAAAPIISPSTPTVTVGSTLNFSANVAVTWSLAAGSLGSISAGGVYTAPTGFFAANNYSQQSGVILRPNDDVANTRIDNLPVDSSSTFRFAHEFTVNGGSNAITFEPTLPTNVYASNNATQNMVFRYTPQLNNSAYVMLSTFTRMSESSVISNRQDPGDPNVQDHHVLGITSDTYRAFELYQPHATGVDALFPNTNAASGFDYYTNNYFLPDKSSGNSGAGTDAAGMAVQPLLLRFSELKSGQINHALRFTLNNPNLYTPADNGWTWPATAQAFHNNCPDGSKNCFHYGARIRVKSTFNCATFTSVGSQAVCTALKQYGGFLVDGGTSWGLTTHYDLIEDTAAYRDIITNMQNVITTQNLEQVDESSLQISSFTGNVNPANGFVTPPQFAQVIAKNNADLTVSSVSIALVPVTVGWTNPTHQGLTSGINVMAASPAYSITIPAWVNGSTDTVFTCSMSPTVGTLTTSAAGCVYTPPTSLYNNVLVTTVTIKSEIDPNHNNASFYVTVFSTDGIRVRMADATSGLDTQPPYDANGIFTDASGNKWFEEPVNNMPPWNGRGSQGSALWPSQLYNQSSTGLGLDKLWGFMVPTCPTGACAQGTWIIQSNHGSNDSADVTASTNTIETANGRIIYSSISVITATFTPKVLTTTVTITGNSLYYAIRANDERGHVPTSFFSILFSSATAAPVVPSAPSGITINGRSLWNGLIRALSQ